jgi:hypothetical protein
VRAFIERPPDVPPARGDAARPTDVILAELERRRAIPPAPARDGEVSAAPRTTP